VHLVTFWCEFDGIRLQFHFICLKFHRLKVIATVNIFMHKWLQWEILLNDFPEIMTELFKVFSSVAIGHVQNFEAL